MRTLHTLGPWKCYELPHTQSDDHSYWHIDAGGGYYSKVGTGFNIAGCISEADARLISAAPDLLEAVSFFVTLMEMDNVPKELLKANVAYQKAKAAIAKATGKKEEGI
jgi:hypothetical protein